MKPQLELKFVRVTKFIVDKFFLLLPRGSENSHALVLLVHDVANETGRLRDIHPRLQHALALRVEGILAGTGGTRCRRRRIVHVRAFRDPVAVVDGVEVPGLVHGSSVSYSHREEEKERGTGH